MPAKDTQNITRLRSYLNFQARIAITDGRVFVGTLVCTDKQKNLILAHTKEYRGGMRLIAKKKKREIKLTFLMNYRGA